MHRGLGFSGKSKLLCYCIYLLLHTCFSLLQLISKNTKNTLQLLLLFCQTYESIHLAPCGFDIYYLPKGTIIDFLHLCVIRVSEVFTVIVMFVDAYS
jgi:hypothetical protein